MKLHKLLILLLLLTGAALAKTPDAKSAIYTAWAEMDRSFSQLEPEGCVKHLQPDFVMTFVERPGMKLTRAQVLSVLKQMMPQIKKAGGKFTASTKVLSVKKLSATSVKAKIKTVGTEQEAAGARVVNTSETREETWILTGGSWKCQSSHIIENKKS